MTETGDTQDSGRYRFRVTGVTWIDDDGQRYRRTIEDGEIVDRPVIR